MPAFSTEIQAHLNPRYLEEGLAVAVSGGLDSVTLLHVLSQKFAVKDRAKLHVLHVNYGLRPESEEEARFVQNLAEAWGHSCHVLKASAPADPSGVQLWARDLRYSFFKEKAQELKVNGIAVAHHANDQAETILWNLCRGTGLSGLKGMEPERTLDDGLVLLRPLLAYTRDELELYASERNLDFRQDQTNFEKTYTRNKIRLDLLPLCEEVHQGAVRHMAQTAQRISDDHEALTILTEDLIQRIVHKESETEIIVQGQALKSAPSALRVRLLQQVYRLLLGEYKVLSHRHLTHIEDFLRGGAIQCQLPAGVVCLLRQNDLILKKSG